MRAGNLRERVELQEDVGPTQDDYGQPVPDWQEIATVWASVLPRSSGERFISGAVQEVAEISHTVRIRYRAGIHPIRQRILWEGRTLVIQSVVDPDGRTREMVLLCREIVEP